MRRKPRLAVPRTGVTFAAGPLERSDLLNEFLTQDTRAKFSLRAQFDDTEELRVVFDTIERLDKESDYYRRWMARSWKETASVWTSYRWWLSASPPIASVLLLIARQGCVRSRMLKMLP